MVISGGFFLLTKDTRRCFLRCLQVSSNLYLLVFWSAVRITSFSVRHRSHARTPLEKVKYIDFEIRMRESFLWKQIGAFQNFTNFGMLCCWLVNCFLSFFVCTNYINFWKNSSNMMSPQSTNNLFYTGKTLPVLKLNWWIDRKRNSGSFEHYVYQLLYARYYNLRFIYFYLIFHAGL